MPFFQNAQGFVVNDAHFTDVKGNVYNQTQRPSALDLILRASSQDALHDSKGRASGCLPGTRVKVLETIMGWVERGSGHFMWLKGPAGAGKSAIAQTIAEECSQRGKLAATFFFKRGTSDRSTGSRVCATIAYQLAMKNKEFQKSLFALIERDPTSLDKALDVQFKNLLLHPLEDISIPDGSPSIVIIDGLDECEVDDLSVLLMAIEGALLRPSLPRLRFVLTSRLEDVINSTFTPFSPLNLEVVNLDRSWDPDSDIAYYLKFEFAKIRKTHRAVRGTALAWPSEKDIRKLVSKSSGQFIYAWTVINFVGKRHTDPIDKLAEILRPNSTFSSAFDHLDALYLQILDAVPDTRSLLEFLGAIVTLQYPMQPILLAQLLPTRLGVLYSALDGLDSLIDIPDASEARDITFHHASFPDFLTNSERAGKYYIHVNSAHEKLAIRCISLQGEQAKGGSHLYTHAHFYASCAWSFHVMNSWPSQMLIEALWKALRNVSNTFSISKTITILWWLKTNVPANLELIQEWQKYYDHNCNPYSRRYRQLMDHTNNEPSKSRIKSTSSNDVPPGPSNDTSNRLRFQSSQDAPSGSSKNTSVGSHGSAPLVYNSGINVQLSGSAPFMYGPNTQIAGTNPLRPTVGSNTQPPLSLPPTFPRLVDTRAPLSLPPVFPRLPLKPPLSLPLGANPNMYPHPAGFNSNQNPNKPHASKSQRFY